MRMMKPEKMKNRHIPILYCLDLLFLLIVIIENVMGLKKRVGSGKVDELTLLFAISVVLFSFLFVMHVIVKKETGAYMLLVISIILFRMSELKYGFAMSDAKVVRKGLQYFTGHQGLISQLILFGIYLLLFGLLGRGISMLLYAVAWTILFAGNYIQMVYHNTFLKPINVLLVGELLGVIGKYISAGRMICGALLLLGIVFLLICCRKKLARAMRPRRQSVFVLWGALTLLLILTGLYENMYLETAKINKDNVWESDVRRLKKEGFAAYTYFELLHLKGIFPDPPQDYCEEKMQSVIAPYQTVDGENENAADAGQQPDVIFVMLESIFDVDVLSDYGVVFSEDPDAVMDRYKLTTTVSPVYGGYTSNVEFEALTGLTNQFLTGGVVPYQTYIANKNTYCYSIVDEFNRHGYETTAIHQNEAGFYNRENVYQSMGFDRFIKRGDYPVTEDTKLNDGFEKNDAFYEMVTTQLENSTQPQFIWGITIESHGGYADKYDETDIDVACDMIEEDGIREAEQYIQSVKNTDILVQRLIEYIDNRKRPTILVMFGDHWPALQVGSVCTDPQKFGETVCLAHANYKELEIPYERLSTNYLGAYVLQFAGIEDAPFFRYLLDLSGKKPVISEMVQDEQFAQETERYRYLQYDLLFGREYIVHPEE